MHWSQGKIYAYMISKERNLNVVYVQLTYYNLESNEVKSFLKKYSKEELEDYMWELINYYKIYVETQVNNRILRNRSIKNLKFPFNEYREGQLSFIKSCYGTIREKEKIFIQAPTGTGKTISTIFPSIKALGEELGEKIFYLTSKGANKGVAEQTIKILKEEGIKAKSITLNAKEKICLNDCVNCNAEECEYANLYYDKLKKSILEIVSNEHEFSTEKIIDYAKKYKICAFELSLDLIEWCDIVICDYNYIFDPRVSLRRVVDYADNIILLIDEAHNLVERSRASYSSSLSKRKFMDLKKELKGIAPKLYRITNKINKLFVEERLYSEEKNEKYSYYREVPKELCKELRVMAREIDKSLSEKKDNNFNNKLLDIYFDINNFLGISELYDDDYYTYIESTKDEVKISLFCANPSKKLKSTMDKFRASVLFSATMSPFRYFINILGGKEDDYRLTLKSPFPKENFKVSLYKANTRYKFRDKTIPEICQVISKFILSNKGNWMVFFPSYEYMKKVQEYIEENNMIDSILSQEANMTVESQERFINEFKTKENITGFCVMGGSFSEGIDLPGEDLIGVIIIGVGYPKVSIEGQIIREHFGEEGENIAYIYPGINKVLQAAGRVIRTECDKGKLLLIDDRYVEKRYFDLLPEIWKPINIIK